MAACRLWLCNSSGNVFTVAASEQYISELTRSKQKNVRVKKLAASSWCTWAVGDDQRIYIYVLATDVPIRVPVTTYENQRWSPFNGFRSSNLLPTDRRAWSDEHGNIYLPKESIRLPSCHWNWEGDWFIDENLQGNICTDHGGWQYAVNFTSKWTAECCWNSYVRKRKWIRFCRFTATNTWALVSDMEVVEKRECFMDIAVGGQLLPGQPPDFLSIWAITNNGQVYVRTGVCRECPEGTGWKHIPCDQAGLIDIACGPTGLVWGVTWDGHGIVRTHVSRDAVYGLGWVLVPYPEESIRLMQVSVGRNSVWALSREGKVWFRQGVNGDKLFWDANAATGSAWVMMVGDMIHIAVSGNDQVFALGQDDEDKEIWFRTGVTPSEPGGKTWQRVVLEEHPDAFDPNSPACLLSPGSQLSLDSSEDTFIMSDYFSVSQKSGLSVPVEKHSSVLVTSDSSPSIKSAMSSAGKEKCVEFHSIDSTASVKFNNVRGKDTASTYCKHIPDNTGVCLLCSEGASLPLAQDTKESTKSWQMIENNLPPSPKCSAPVTFQAEEVGERASIKALITSVMMPANSNLQSTVKKSVFNSSLSTAERRRESTDCLQNGEREAGLGEGDAVNSRKISELQFQSPAVEDDPGVLTSSVHSLSDHLDSLESGPSSDIINFVTDLIDEKDEQEGGAGKSSQVFQSGGTVTFQDMHNLSQAGDMSSHLSSIPWISLGPSMSFTGKMSFSADTPPEVKSIPAMTLTLAQPRYVWCWLGASDCLVENPALVPWLAVPRGPDSYSHCNIPKLSKAVRDSILQMLRHRNQREVKGFDSYEHAVEKTTWVKKTEMKLQWPDRTGAWYDCSLEMEQGIGDKIDGTLTIQFKLKNKPKVIQMSLQEIRCIKMCDDHHLSVYTCDPEAALCPLTLETCSEAELHEWLGILNLANLSLWQLNCPIAPGSVCTLTVPGDIFIHSPDLTRTKPSEMMWGQHGGHMAVIETTPCGVIWAISFDHTPWVYNGGYGNSLIRELSDTACDLREQVDYRTIQVFENQKWFPMVGYCSRGIFHDNFAWTTPKGKFVRSREDIKLPSSQWQWVSDWMVDFTTEGGVCNDGWQYASNFHRPFHPYQGLRDSVRRRQWSRKCKLVTQGPWVSMGPPELIDISIQVDVPSSPSQPLVIWAIGANGAVLCRSDATQSKPMGKSWIHITTISDMPFKSVSVGGHCRVWAIAADGSVWYRASVSPLTPTGLCWIQVVPPPPGGAMLQQISVGGTAVWAVDTAGNLWRREEIMPTFPEGTKWTFVCNRVRRVSVGPIDQVCVVTDTNFGRNRHPGGVIYQRLGITEATPSGTNWELIIGPDWHYISVRGLMAPNK